MSSAPWKAILTAVAKAEGTTLREWADDCDEQAARLSSAIPVYLRKPNSEKRR